ncbi:unnamed protein product [Clavelina lepadiformis]|uniref:Vesicular, overexpressed in cancer, prosurvival protein 1 n=1 Tax=Clavelina lepadiformis TaxID=159417 RepID=A0ABP0EYE8_CLALP
MDTLKQTSPTRTVCMGLLWILLPIDFAMADAICSSSRRYPVKYCYGITAYCCGSHLQNCCWEEIWKVWWFWVIVFVVLTALFACLGYYCSAVASEPTYGVLRTESFNIFHRFRRSPSQGYEPIDESWKPPDHVELPPYTPTASQSAPLPTDSNISQNMPYLEPPPPYTTVATHPQPESTEETTVVPSAPPEEAAGSSQSAITSTATSTVVSSR